MQPDMFLHTYRYAILFLLIFSLHSCTEEDGSRMDPHLKLVAGSGYTTGDSLIVPGTVMRFKLELQAGSEPLTNFYISVIDSDGFPTRYFDTAMYLDQLIWTGSFYKGPDSPENWEFVVRDRRGGEARTSIEILADTGSSYKPVTSIQNLLLGAQNNAQFGSFFAFLPQEVYTTVEAKQNQEIIDVVYYFGVDAHTIASPGANIEDDVFTASLNPKYWDIRNTTRYIKTSLTVQEFENIQNDSIFIAAYVEAEGKRKAKNLQAGDVFVFRNENQMLGMFLVNAIDGSEEGNVELDIKIQSEKK
jgi:hypothetical protein